MDECMHGWMRQIEFLLYTCIQHGVRVNLLCGPFSLLVRLGHSHVPTSHMVFMEYIITVSDLLFNKFLHTSLAKPSYR